MSPDPKLRSALQRLVPPPDVDAGWEQVSRRLSYGRRQKAMLVAAAAVVSFALGAAVVSTVDDGGERLELVNPPTSAIAPRPAPTDLPDSSTTATITPTVPGTVTLPGTLPGTVTPTTGGTTPPTGSSAPAPTQSAPAPTTAPPATADASILTAADPGPGPSRPQPVVKNEISSFLDGKNEVRSIGDTNVPATDPAGAPEQRLVVQVALRADAVDLADELIARWGDDVSVILGFFPYPEAPPVDKACPAPRSLLPLYAELAASTTIDPSPIRRGADFTGKLTLTNNGEVPFGILAGGANAVDLLLPDSDTVVATFDGTVQSEPKLVTVAPKGKVELSLLGATASCTGLGGFSVPAGAYVGRVQVSVNDVSLEYRFPVTVID